MEWSTIWIADKLFKIERQIIYLLYKIDDEEIDDHKIAIFAQKHKICSRPFVVLKHQNEWLLINFLGR